MFRVSMAYLRVTIGHPKVTVGHPRVTISHLRATMGHLRLFHFEKSQVKSYFLSTSMLLHVNLYEVS